jgi:DNA-binding transcriptional MerR regulator
MSEVRNSDRLTEAANQCGVTVETLREWLDERLIELQDEMWDEQALDMARRIRRLVSLGLNLPGVEVALYMRNQLIRQQEEMRRFREEMEQIRAHHEQRIAHLMRQLSEW